jgi:tetratricopeptide (TPR) repeat protein
MGRGNEALPLLREVVKKEPNNVDAWVDLASCYAERGFYAEASKALDKALEHEPEDVMANYRLASLHAMQEQLEDALTPLRKALSLDPVRVRSWFAHDRSFDGIRRDAAVLELLNQDAVGPVT